MSPRLATGARQKLGHLSLLLFADGHVTPSAYNFKSPADAEILVAPLGSWAAEIAAAETLRGIDARARDESPAITPVYPTLNDLEPMRQFLDHPGNHAAYFELGPASNAESIYVYPANG
jgi:hypothetical protein